MCFYSNTNETKIASKPIRVYKLLEKNNEAPAMFYKYYRGLNTPEHPETSYVYYKCQNLYEYGGGWLHALKHYEKKYSNSSIHHMVMMFIPKGCKYHDEGIAPESLQDCTNHIISEALYWPKNWFDYLKWFIKSL